MARIGQRPLSIYSICAVRARKADQFPASLAMPYNSLWHFIQGLALHRLFALSWVSPKAGF